MRSTVRRTLSAAAVIALATGTAACGTDDDGTESIDSTYDSVDTDPGVTVDSMVGLEVTTVGNISEVLSEEALRIDRDGLGALDDQGEVGLEFDGIYDYDYYDYEALTELDDEFDDTDVVDEGVLVVAPDGTEGREVDEAVRVSGTIRRWDQDVLETTYELNLEQDEIDGKGDVLVIVADTISAADQAPAGGQDDAVMSGGSASASPSDEASDEG